MSKINSEFIQEYVQIFSLRSHLLNKEQWNSCVILDPNSILREIECKNISVVFVCSNDLKYSVHVAHLPFLCRLNQTKLVILKHGSAVELQSYFGKKNLFMFAISKNCDTAQFSEQFPEIEPFDPTSLPQMLIKK